MSAEPITRESEDQASEETGAQSSAAPLPKIGYDYREAQEITGLGRTTLWEAVDDGRLKCFKVGRRVLFSLKHLEDFMKAYENGADGDVKPRRKARARYV